MIKSWALALTATIGLAGAARAAPLEVYGKLPAIEQAVISPSGAYVAYVVTNGEQRKVAVQATADHKLKGVAAAGDEKVRDIRWASDDHLIITTSTSRQPTNLLGGDALVGPRTEYLGAQDLNLRTGRMHGLLESVSQPAEVRNQFTTTKTILGLPVVRRVGGKPVAFVRSFYFTDTRGRLGLFRVDLDSGAAYLVERGEREAYDWAISADGRTMAEAAYSDNPGVWALLLKGPGGWRPAQTIPAPIDAPDLVGLGRDGKSVLVETADDKTGVAWRELSTETGQWGEAIPMTDGQAAIHDPADGRLIGQVAIFGDTLTYDFFDPHDAQVWRAVANAFPGAVAALESWSDDRKKIIVLVDSPGQSPAYALVDLTTGSADWLSDEYAGLTSQDISPVKPIRYKAADGLEITGYLTLPRGRDPHGLPLVVLAHGGPAARDEPGFDWWAQALASRGFAVLQANYRGSAGFGRDFLAAGFGQWGRKMQTDLSDGVRDLVRQGVVDPKRVCIVGGSYGGYAALAGATLDRGVYRCAISYAGPSDLRSQVGWSRERGGLQTLRFWERFIGAASLDDPLLEKLSPAEHAGDVQIPVLLIHGRDDTIVPISQSRRMADALRAAGKPVELVELDGEDHWLSRGATRLQMLQAAVAFLEKNDPPN